MAWFKRTKKANDDNAAEKTRNEESAKNAYNFIKTNSGKTSKTKKAYNSGKTSKTKKAYNSGKKSAQESAPYKATKKIAKGALKGLGYAAAGVLLTSLYLANPLAGSIVIAAGLYYKSQSNKNYKSQSNIKPAQAPSQPSSPPKITAKSQGQENHRTSESSKSPSSKKVNQTSKSQSQEKSSPEAKVLNKVKKESKEAKQTPGTPVQTPQVQNKQEQGKGRAI